MKEPLRLYDRAATAAWLRTQLRMLRRDLRRRRAQKPLQYFWEEYLRQRGIARVKRSIRAAALKLKAIEGKKAEQ